MSIKQNDDRIVKIAKALSDKTRVRILREIVKRKRVTCGDAVHIAALAQPTVSHHVKVLVDAGLLLSEKEGRHVIISVNRAALKEFSALVLAPAKA